MQHFSDVLEYVPENITIQGSHDFISGDYTGSISAASLSLDFLIGADIEGSTALKTMTVTWQ